MGRERVRRSGGEKECVSAYLEGCGWLDFVMAGFWGDVCLNRSV